jgi:hypothetical protein
MALKNHHAIDEHPDLCVRAWEVICAKSQSGVIEIMPTRENGGVGTMQPYVHFTRLGKPPVEDGAAAEGGKVDVETHRAFSGGEELGGGFTNIGSVSLSPAIFHNTWEHFRR